MLFPMYTASHPIWQLFSCVGKCINFFLFHIQIILTTICGHRIQPTEIQTLNVSSESEANNIRRTNLPVLSVDIWKEEGFIENELLLTSSTHHLHLSLSASNEDDGKPTLRNFFALRGRKMSEILVITIKLYFLAQVCFAKRKISYTSYFNLASVPFRPQSTLTFRIILWNCM